MVTGIVTHVGPPFWVAHHSIVNDASDQ
ncbi:hypothetical protein JL09_g5325 [Pichia kudriavzevii]|uniref:Uncharacterized protein n=1 Tax=Pichia kudriavzevii TaxID=4909 RepID=A0A099NSH0_PICKU|nr:hypothetical protein JL09_g5325 [Pichia kudriavzevii]